MEYKLYTPGLEKGWSNGMIAFGAHPPIKRQTPCYLAGQGCHDTEHLGWRKRCGIGIHQWELNFHRHTSHHYHCLYCGIGDDRYSVLGLGPIVEEDWIKKLEKQQDGA